MTIVHLIKNLSDEEEKGETISLEKLNKLDKANVYNLRIDGEKDIDKKYRVGLTSEEVQLMVNSGIYKEVYIKEIYNRIQELSKIA